MRKRIYEIFFLVVAIMDVINTAVQWSTKAYSLGLSRESWLAIGGIVFFMMGLALMGVYVFRREDKKGNRPHVSNKPGKEKFSPNMLVLDKGFEFYPQRQSIAWLKGELSKASEVRCFWIAGGTAKQNDVLGIRTITQLILADPSEDNPAIDQIVTRMPDGATPQHIREMIRELSDIALQRGIRVRLWTGFPCDIMVFANPTGDDAWVLMDMVLPHLSADQRPQFRIWKRRFPQLYKNLLSVYDQIWDKSQEPAHSLEQVAAYTAFLRSLKAVAEKLLLNARGNYMKSASFIFQNICGEVQNELNKWAIEKQDAKLLKEEFWRFESKVDNFNTRVSKLDASFLSDGKISSLCSETMRLVDEYRQLVKELVTFINGVRQQGITSIWESSAWAKAISELADEYDELMGLMKDLRRDTPERLCTLPSDNEGRLDNFKKTLESDLPSTSHKEGSHSC
jgi:hypothetical protein